MTTTDQLCPRCGNECGRDEVDVGVGILYGPWGCYCGWSESADYDVSDGPRLTPEGYEVDQWGGLTPPPNRTRRRVTPADRPPHQPNPGRPGSKRWGG